MMQVSKSYFCSYFKEITQKEFGTMTGEHANTWTNRERDWYNAERRFVFAARTAKERDWWVNSMLEEGIQRNKKIPSKK